MVVVAPSASARRPGGTTSASSASPAVQTVAKPIPNSARAPRSDQKSPASPWATAPAAITTPEPSVSARAPIRSAHTPTGTDTAIDSTLTVARIAPVSTLVSPSSVRKRGASGTIAQFTTSATSRRP